MALTKAFELSRALCEVFGLDENTVHSLTLHLSAEDAAVLLVERYVTVAEDGKADRLKREVGRYRLQEDD